MAPSHMDAAPIGASPIGASPIGASPMGALPVGAAPADAPPLAPGTDQSGSPTGALGLETARLSKRFLSRGEETVALAEVDIAVPKGGFLSVIGPSGCGKSTMLRIFADLAEPTAGSARVNGKSPRDARLARECGVVFQSPNLLPWKTVLKNVILPLQVMGVDRTAREETARQMLDLVGLSGFERRLPAQLSGGMQQRVAIARALSMRPSVLLMDEPFGALDEITRDRLNLELMTIWRQLAPTVLFITHSISEAVFLSDEVVVMSPRPGRVTASIPVDLPFPRTAETRDDPHYFELVSQVRHELTAVSVP